MDIKLGVFYQAAPPPPIDGIKKPMKPGGYSDSGADLVFALKSSGQPVVTPVQEPDTHQHLDWVFPDTLEGIEAALALGANVLWMNTVLFSGHPMESFYGRGLKFVCQHPEDVNKFDDKFQTNRLLIDLGLPVAHSSVVAGEIEKLPTTLHLPLMLKPIRGRGSAGVSLIETYESLVAHLKNWSATGEFGTQFMLEEVLPGDEITITVLPKGAYDFGNGDERTYENAWALRPIRRFDHVKMVSPWNGTVPVVKNSVALSKEEVENPRVSRVMEACEEVGDILEIRAPIRIDCRQDAEGFYRIFDVNPKPNITGAGRPGRDNQDSLVTMAAQAEGISYAALVRAIAQNAWAK